ncbi:transporter [Azospirillum sp. TSH58]|uniref:AEC family transporter n=1 Tax=Azospirillum sp. TSH58 TaxID=664962 RepID=UPI000D601924|nr:AEC family transporter [Azospirillum sp. TSH58]AWJ83714.1 transporter [Azospirillum sp. TSH58]PWC61977.1 transporter [Azospirillum sp. TSH58]
MSVVINVALPVFAIILAGVLSGKAKLLGPASSEALNKFVYWMALPPVLFLGTAKRSVAEIFNGPFIGAFLGSMLAVYALGALLGWLIHRERTQIQCMQGLNACFSNTGYMGIPLFLAAFGPDRLAPAILATVIMSAIMVGIAVIWLEFANSQGGGIGKALRDVGRALVKNPLIISTALGLAWSVFLSGMPVPRPIAIYCDLMGASAGPCALFAIGLFLATQSLKANLLEVGWISALKLVVQPALAWLLIQTLFPLDPFWAGSAIILAGLPTGALTFVVASQYRIYVERTSAAILMSTIASVVTLSFLLATYAPSL